MQYERLLPSMNITRLVILCCLTVNTNQRSVFVHSWRRACVLDVNIVLLNLITLLNYWTPSYWRQNRNILFI